MIGQGKAYLAKNMPSVTRVDCVIRIEIKRQLNIFEPYACAYTRFSCIVWRHLWLMMVKSPSLEWDVV